mgnify:CR=1 FL=1
MQVDGRLAPVVTRINSHQTTAFWPLDGGAMAVTPDGMLLVPQDGSICAVPTGLIDLDKLLGGLQKSDLLIIAGRPGMGKTGFMRSVLKNAAQRYKKHVAMFSLEMSKEQLVQRRT